MGSRGRRRNGGKARVWASQTATTWLPWCLPEEAGAKYGMMGDGSLPSQAIGPEEGCDPHDGGIWPKFVTADDFYQGLDPEHLRRGQEGFSGLRMQVSLPIDPRHGRGKYHLMLFFGAAEGAANARRWLPGHPWPQFTLAAYIEHGWTPSPRSAHFLHDQGTGLPAVYGSLKQALKGAENYVVRNALSQPDEAWGWVDRGDEIRAGLRQMKQSGDRFTVKAKITCEPLPPDRVWTDDYGYYEDPSVVRLNWGVVDRAKGRSNPGKEPVPATKRTERVDGLHISAIGVPGKWPIGDLYHAKKALEYLLAFPVHAPVRPQVIHAVEENYPEYNWAAWWNKRRKGKKGIKTWAAYCKEGAQAHGHYRAAANPFY